ncbi:MAG: hypothetical protein ACK55I_47865, partial [bacterium]
WTPLIHCAREDEVSVLASCLHVIDPVRVIAKRLIYGILLGNTELPIFAVTHRKDIGPGWIASLGKRRRGA